MELREQVRAWLDAHEEEMVRDIGRLVRYRSVSRPGTEDAPYGPECAAALAEMLDMGRDYGFETRKTAAAPSPGKTAGKPSGFGPTWTWSPKRRGGSIRPIPAPGRGISSSAGALETTKAPPWAGFTPCGASGTWGFLSEAASVRWRAATRKRA